MTFPTARLGSEASEDPHLLRVGTIRGAHDDVHSTPRSGALPAALQDEGQLLPGL